MVLEEVLLVAVGMAAASVLVLVLEAVLVEAAVVDGAGENDVMFHDPSLFISPCLT